MNAGIHTRRHLYQIGFSFKRSYPMYKALHEGPWVVVNAYPIYFIRSPNNA